MLDTNGYCLEYPIENWRIGRLYTTRVQTLRSTVWKCQFIDCEWIHWTERNSNPAVVDSLDWTSKQWFNWSRILKWCNWHNISLRLNLPLASQIINENDPSWDPAFLQMGRARTQSALTAGRNKLDRTTAPQRNVFYFKLCCCSFARFIMEVSSRSTQARSHFLYFQ